MLNEIKNVHQPAREQGFRRWFSDEELELIVWYSAAGEISGFQLCYDLQGTERSFTWKKDGALKHAVIDSGEDSPLQNQSPMLFSEPAAPVEFVVAEFKTRSEMLEPGIVELVSRQISAYDGYRRSFI